MRTGIQGVLLLQIYKSFLNPDLNGPLGFGAQKKNKKKTILFPLVLFPHCVDCSPIAGNGWNHDERGYGYLTFFLNEYFRFVEMHRYLTSNEVWQVFETGQMFFLFWKVFAPHDGHKPGVSKILFS